MNLSKHFTLEEATFSRTAISWGLPNNPNEKQLAQMKFTAAKMELVRELLGDHAIRVNSWFRGPEVNEKVGGVPTSQHAKGEAVDFTCAGFGSAKKIAEFLSRHKETLQYDQLIYEQTWVHISFTLSNPRGNDLTFLGRGKYVPGIV